MRPGQKVRFRRSPHLVCYWNGADLVFENYATGARVAAHPFAAALLHFFYRWRSPAQLAVHFPQYTSASLAHAVTRLARATLLERSDRPQTPAPAALRGWKKWHPHSGLFHFATKRLRYVADPRAAMRDLLRLARRQPMPPAIQRRGRGRAVALPAPRATGEFPQVLRERRTWRSFAARPLALADLSTLLGLTWRVQRWVRLRGLGRFAEKTSPSGGGLHPLEVYVVARRVQGLANGIYHYESDRHLLRLLRRGAPAVASYIPGQPWFRSAPALLLMTAVFARPLWKYSSPRAYSAVLIEAGHFCQTFCLAATWLKLAPFCTLALDDARIEADLRIDGASESVLYAAGVGVRPPRGRPPLSAMRLLRSL